MIAVVRAKLTVDVRALRRRFVDETRELMAFHPPG